MGQVKQEMPVKAEARLAKERRAEERRAEELLAEERRYEVRRAKARRAEARLFDLLEEPDPLVRAGAYREGTGAECFDRVVKHEYRALVDEVEKTLSCKADAPRLVSDAFFMLFLVANLRLGSNPEELTGLRVPRFELRREIGIRQSVRQMLGKPLKGRTNHGLLSKYFREQGKMRGLIPPDLTEEPGRLDAEIADEHRRIAEALRVEPDTAEKIDSDRQRAALRDCLPTAGRNVLVTMARHGFDLNSRQDLIELVEKVLPRRESRKVVSRLRRERLDEYDGGPVSVELLSRILDLSVRTISRMADRGMAELLELLGAWRPKIAA